MHSVDKQNVASAFGRAVETYDQQAILQREVANRLIANVKEENIFAKVLDAGCGTGYVSQNLKYHKGYEITALDLSHEMLQKAQDNNVAHHYLLGDIESLPLVDNQFDVVVSSLAIQWCHSLTLAISELLRVLKPQGRLYLSTLTQPSLWELAKAWQALDDDPHVLTFLSDEEIVKILSKLQEIYVIQSVNYSAYCKALRFDHIVALLKSLQGIGATALPYRKKGLMGKNQLKLLSESYPKNVLTDQLALTYQIAEIVIVKG